MLPGATPDNDTFGDVAFGPGPGGVASLFEGSTLVILVCVAMPLKYMAGMPMAVRVTGMIHGVLFLLFLVREFEKGRPQHPDAETLQRRAGVDAMQLLLQHEGVGRGRHGFG